MCPQQAVRTLPGARHGAGCLPEHRSSSPSRCYPLLHRISHWVETGALALADLGHEGEADIFRTPVKKTTGPT
jgi:hypothetical protein